MLASDGHKTGVQRDRTESRRALSPRPAGDEDGHSAASARSNGPASAQHEVDDLHADCRIVTVRDVLDFGESVDDHLPPANPFRKVRRDEDLSTITRS